MFFDSHAHITTQKDISVNKYCESAIEADLHTIISVGCSPDHLFSNIQLCLQNTSEKLQLYPSIGVHPDYFQNPDITEEHIHQELDTIEHLFDSLYTKHRETIVALGECGLDYYWPHHKEAQRRLLELHIQKSFLWDLPLIIHVRDAWDDFLTVLETHPDMRAVIHCFSGDQTIANKVLSYPNTIISFSGIVTFPKAQEQFVETIKTIPEHRFLIETDTPYLAPVPFRGKPNEPAYVVHTAAHIAAIRGVTTEDIGTSTSQNGKAFFRI